MNKSIVTGTDDRAVTVGSGWRIGGDVVTVVAVTGANRVVVESLDGEQRSARPGELEPVDAGLAAADILSRRGADVSPEEWERARRMLADIQDLGQRAECAGPEIEALAAKWNVSRATVWRRIHRYRREHSLLAFLDRRPGPSKGAPQLASESDAVIGDVARRWWHQTNNATVAEIAPTVQAECKARGLPIPSRATVARRLRQLRTDPDNFSGEARRTLRERRQLVKSSYVIERALDVVQVDHTVADVFLVDTVSRRPIGRPTLTVAIDVATRCVLGFCLSLEAPSSLLVALCLEHAVFPKDAWLGALGASVEWPMYGRMRALHSDNGKEFHSSAFRRGCDLNRIDVIYRPPATPRFGGHVERLIGTLMRRVRLLPGTSYSDLLGRRPRRAESQAALTLGDLRWILTEDIARYHESTHRSLGMSPRTAWEHAWRRERGIEVPALPAARMAFLLDFLPAVRRVIGREGIELFRLRYSDRSLASEVNPAVQRVIRFDPRDLSRVYVEGADGHYLTVPLRDPRWPAMSLWEWRAMLRQQRVQAERADGDRIRATLERLRPISSDPGTPLRRQRKLARRAEWQALQVIQALPAPNVTLAPTLTSENGPDDLEWEVLE